MSRLSELQSHIESGFLGFWVRKYRISYLIVLLVIIALCVEWAMYHRDGFARIRRGIAVRLGRGGAAA